MAEPQKLEDKAKHYRLKSMVLGRIFAEITVLLILVSLPAILTATGHMQEAAMSFKVVIFSLSLISAVVLPAYAFVTWIVKIDKEGITAMSVAKHQHCDWRDIKRISRRSNWNWVRYVIEHKHGELSFPFWLKDCDELIGIVRNKMPAGAGIPSPFRKFSQDPIGLVFQSMQAAFGIGLVAIFWFFCGELMHEKSTNQMDAAIVFGFCIILTALCMWRTFFVILMPRSIEVTGHGIIVATMLFSRRIGWQYVVNVTPSLPLLPEGFMLRTKKGSFLIGNGMDAADELVSSITSKLKIQEQLAKPLEDFPQQKPGETVSSAKAQSQILDFSPDQKDGKDVQITTDTTKSESSSVSPTTAPMETTPEQTDVPTSPDKEESETRSKSAKEPGGKKADRKFRRKKKNRP